MLDLANTSRRSFVASLGAGLAVMLGAPRWTPHRCHRSAAAGPHPDPRPDIDASKVPTHEELANTPHVIDLYDGIREIPHVVDGIRCKCGCADLPGYRSLLTCFEGDGMAKWCQKCQTEGRVVVRLHKAGRTLDQIRAAVDARFGDG